MTTTPTATYGPTACHLCGNHTECITDGRGFLLCLDASSCLARVERMELAEYFRLQEMAKCLRERLATVLRRQGALEVKLGLYDAALAEHRAELKKIEESEGTK